MISLIHTQAVWWVLRFQPRVRKASTEANHEGVQMNVLQRLYKGSRPAHVQNENVVHETELESNAVKRKTCNTEDGRKQAVRRRHWDSLHLVLKQLERGNYCTDPQDKGDERHI